MLLRVSLGLGLVCLLAAGGCGSSGRGAGTASGGRGARPDYVTVRVSAATAGTSEDYDLHVSTTEVTLRQWEEVMGCHSAILLAFLGLVATRQAFNMEGG